MSITHEAETTTLGALDRILRMSILRQFIKYSLVGLGSTIIHLGTYRFLWNLGVPAGFEQLALPAWFSAKDLYMVLANSIGFCLAVTNGFIWNRIWTFKGAHRRGAKAQYLLFVLVNIVGLCLSNGTVLVLVNLLHHWGKSETIGRLYGPLLAIPAVLLWNFTANRHWTFAAPAAGE